MNAELQLWRRIRGAIDGYASHIVPLLGESYGRDSLQQAWREFTLGGHTQFIENDPHSELFFSWLFHCWSPEPGKGAKVADRTLYGVSPTRAYLARNASRLNPILRRYLQACLDTPFGFYEITECRPNIAFQARNVLTGAEFEVSESLASLSLKNGDIVFAHILSLDGISLMEATSPFSFPSAFLTHVTRRQRDREFRDRPDVSLRRLYFDLLGSYLFAG